MESKILDPKVKEAFSVFQPTVRKKLMQLRALIFDVAAETQGAQVRCRRVSLDCPMEPGRVQQQWLQAPGGGKGHTFYTPTPGR